MNKIVFETIQKEVVQNGFFMVKDLLKLAEKFKLDHQELEKGFLTQYRGLMKQKRYTLCDYVARKQRKIHFGQTTLDMVENGVIEDIWDSKMTYKRSQIKEVCIIGIFSQEMARQKINEVLDKHTIHKSKPYKGVNKPSRMIIQGEPMEKVTSNIHENESKLPKKSLRRELKAQQEKKQSKLQESKRYENPVRHLILIGSSQSQECHSKDLRSQIALFNMVDSKQQVPPHSQSHQQSHQLNKDQKTRPSKDTKFPRTKSKEGPNIVEKQNLPKEKAQSKMIHNTRGASKKEASKAQIEKQSKFMSNWVKKIK